MDKIATRKPAAEPAAEPKAGPAAEETRNKNNKSNLKLQQDFIREIIDKFFGIILSIRTHCL